MHEEARNRPSSIDLSLELERQLEIDSLPNTPDVSQTRFTERPQSLDPHVLASIVTQLRLSLAEVSKERDDFSQTLSEVQEREANLKDALHTVSERCLKLEQDLAVVTEKRQEEADAVTMLRGKLEDSRRALMRLQTENRRASMTLDLSRAGPSSFQGPPSSRRSSFAPLTGSPGIPGLGAHRRISSVSEPGASFRADLGSPPLSSSGRLEPLQLVNGGPSPTLPTDRASRRMSGFFGRGLPNELPTTTDASEVEELRKELVAVKESLEETRVELAEAREAQEASETCANALRTFIAENSIGMHPPGRSAPAPPQSAGVGAEHSRKNTSWSFKLWNTAIPATNSPTASPAILSAPPSAPVTAPPLSKKFGGFFSSRSSISSTSSANRAEPHSHQQEPVFNGSDASSVDSSAEPVSPVSELPAGSILVQSFDDAQSQTGLSGQTRKIMEEPVHLGGPL
ncbi:hypothetical protein BDY19DRAFT_885524 [Irpex rosettiformis]|uniref:Uncharacterized protein n=1 Tax=Irpex rosettiformis TaxID=378272 RepID=A0ACB8UC99_9APHY|nr:hypothetical protein BDY19DRAFT_885524 [Irpex rosettiformis]